MSMVKKWSGCILSFIAGVLSLALSACTGMTVVVSAGGTVLQESTTKAFEIITNAELADQAELYQIGKYFTPLKVFSIILLVVAILLIAYSIVLLLKNLNVIKSSHVAFDIVSIVLVVLFLVAVIGVFVSTSIYGKAMVEALTTITGGANVVAKIGAYQIVMLITAIIAAVTTTVFTILNRKSA